jgi:catechol 2,3-dioxygenase-like lactoylglutathione lyase family enzyme
MDRPGRNLIQIRAIDHLVIRSENVAVLQDFYCTVLGCTLERKLDPEIGLVQLRAGNSLIDLVDVHAELGRMGGPAPGTKAHNVDHFCLEIDPADEQDVLDWLASHGIKGLEFARRYGANGFGRSVYVPDPDGNTVELKLAASTE